MTSSNGDKKGIEIFENFDNFKFKEILNSDVARKSIFILFEHNISKSQAILICDKHGFEENENLINEWASGASLRLLTSNDIYGNYELLLPQKFNEIKSTFIYPATEKHIEKYRRQEFFLLQETPKDYNEITLEYIKESQMNLTWVYNFLEKKSEAERIIFEDSDAQVGFLLAPDLKWNGENVDELYLQAVVKRRDLHSIRDLTNEELPLLENIRDKVRKVVLEKYGLKKNQLKMYFHYQPSYYHLHVHINNIKYDAPGLSYTSVLLDNVISNIQIMSDFYRKTTLSFIRKANDPLFKKYLDADRV